MKLGVGEGEMFLEQSHQAGIAFVVNCTLLVKLSLFFEEKGKK